MKVISVVSGGLDSVAYVSQFDHYDVYALAFDYGQKGRRELEALELICKELPFVEELRVVDVKSLADLWTGTQLTSEEVAIEESYTRSVVVPLRNCVMLSIACAYAYSIGAYEVIFGSHLSDTQLDPVTGEMMYPDCSPAFTKALELAVRLGHFFEPLTISSPAIEGLTKVQLLKSVPDDRKYLLSKTWSCYHSGEKQCGVCESCINRKLAFKAAGIPDETEYEE
jgi:7-cyano-7-deazaguanine synthase